MPAGMLGWVFASVLLSLRVAPVFTFAPPFSLTQTPAMFRALFGVGIAACLVAGTPQAAALPDYEMGTLVAVGARELLLGVVFVLAFQLMFAAIAVAGRTIDIQAGFGLALLIDPRSNSQNPLVGTLIAYAAAAVFFALDGHHDLLRIIAASLDSVPLGQGRLPETLGPLTAFIGAVFVAAFGVAGGAILGLFVADLAIAMLSRTAPQLNVLVMGFQVKTLLLFVLLPAVFGVGGALLARLARVTLEAIPRLL